jgi:hypothetical protein
MNNQIVAEYLNIQQVRDMFNFGFLITSLDCFAQNARNNKTMTACK